MTDITPFRGIRYNDARYADLSPLLAPPDHTVIPAELETLRKRSDRNAVNLVLGNPEAAASWPMNDWLDDETLVQDRVPAVYLLDQEFEVEGERKVRHSFIARLRVETFGRGSVFASEEPLPDTDAEPLEVMRATKMNTNHVLGIYGADEAVGAALAKMAELDPIGEGTGTDGVRNVLRAVYHPRLIAELVATFRERRVVVVDGHERYAAALAYRDERRIGRSSLTFNEPYEFISAVLVAENDPGLAIQPVHRLVSGAKDFESDSFFAKAAGDFEIEEVAAEAGAILARLGKLADRHAFGAVTQSGARVLVRKTGKRDASGSPESLDSRILSERILAKLLMIERNSTEETGTVACIESAAECIAAVAEGRAQLALLLNAVNVAEIEAGAVSGCVMPPKSAVFFPGVPAGLVINPLM